MPGAAAPQAELPAVGSGGTLSAERRRGGLGLVSNVCGGCGGRQLLALVSVGELASRRSYVKCAACRSSERNGSPPDKLAAKTIDQIGPEVATLVLDPTASKISPGTHGRIINLTCAAALRDQWRDTTDNLPERWCAAYTEIFDEDDLRLTVNQRVHHFAEWVAAIYFFHATGARTLLAKYANAAHPRKVAAIDRMFSPEVADFLRSMVKDLKVQSPDLLAYMLGGGRFWFAEVKGPGDTLKPRQLNSHQLIGQRLGVDVDIVNVALK